MRINWIRLGIGIGLLFTGISISALLQLAPVQPDTVKNAEMAMIICFGFLITALAFETKEKLGG